MIEALKKIVTMVITLAAKILIFRFKPEVIAITGSAGKTTTKEFLRELLEIDFEVMAPAEGYNTELGAPLAFFNEKTPASILSVKEWLLIILRVYKKAFFLKAYPDVLVVEMGADKPGDIRYLSRVFRPDKGIVLSVLNTHLVQFKTIEHVAKEKSELVKAVKPEGKVYLNSDDEYVRKMAPLAKAKVILFGTEDPTGYKASSLKTDMSGLRFNLRAGEKSYKIAAPIFGQQMVYSLLAAIAVARSKHISMDKLVERVKKLKPFKGRMNVLEGIKDSIIIDDSYNANPDSMFEALEFLSKVEGRKIAALGTMNELGDSEPAAHQKVGEKAATSVNILVTVGEPAKKYLAKAAEKAGMTQVKSFSSSEEAGEYLKGIIKKGDVILAKGSQNNVRMEKAVEKIMAHPEERVSKLVRQSQFWKEN